MDQLMEEVAVAVGERLRGGADTVDDIARDIHERVSRNCWIRSACCTRSEL